MCVCAERCHVALLLVSFVILIINAYLCLIKEMSLDMEWEDRLVQFEKLHVIEVLDLFKCVCV